MSLKGDIVREYLNKFSETPSLSLARKIFEENKSVFKDVENVRDLLRYYRGAHGKKARKNMTHKSKKYLQRSDNCFKLPESEKEKEYVITLPKQCKNVLILSDIHLPYHSITALNLALDYGKRNEVGTIILNGDTIDFHAVSYFNRDPRDRDLKYELDATRAFLEELRKQFPKALIYWKNGNHEERWERYLMTKAPELLDIQEFKLDVILRMNDFDIKYFECSKSVIKLGKLNVFHGHEFGKSIFSPVNPARGLYMKAKENAIEGHHHRTSEHTEKTVSDKVITCWSTGCLCQLKADYRPFNSWNHGFAHVIVDNDGFQVKNIRIIGNKIV